MGDAPYAWSPDWQWIISTHSFGTDAKLYIMDNQSFNVKPLMEENEFIHPFWQPEYQAAPAEPIDLSANNFLGCVVAFQAVMTRIGNATLDFFENIEVNLDNLISQTVDGV